MLKNPTHYPLSGLVSLVIGMIIITAGFNVHSETFIYLIGIFGFLLFLPLILLIKSIKILAFGMDDASSGIKTSALVLTLALALCWSALVTIALWWLVNG